MKKRRIKEKKSGKNRQKRACKLVRVFVRERRKIELMCAWIQTDSSFFTTAFVVRCRFYNLAAKMERFSHRYESKEAPGTDPNCRHSVYICALRVLGAHEDVYLLRSKKNLRGLCRGVSFRALSETKSHTPPKYAHRIFCGDTDNDGYWSGKSVLPNDWFSPFPNSGKLRLHFLYGSLTLIINKKKK